MGRKRLESKLEAEGIEAAKCINRRVEIENRM